MIHDDTQTGYEPADNSRLLTVDDVARVFNVLDQTVKNWVRKGQIDVIRLPGGTLRFSLAAVMALAKVSGGDMPLITVAVRKVVTGVYFIRSGEFVKIGFASDVQGRFRSLSCSTPFDTRLVHVIPTASVDEAHQLERTLHVRFASSRHRYEWFRFEPDVTAYLADLCRIDA